VKRPLPLHVPPIDRPPPQPSRGQSAALLPVLIARGICVQLFVPSGGHSFQRVCLLVLKLHLGKSLFQDVERDGGFFPADDKWRTETQ